MCPRVSTGSWSHRTRARLHDDGLSDGGHCFLQVGNQGGDLHHHHVALKQHDNTSRHSAPPTHRAGGGAGEGGGANSKTTQAVIQRLPLTGLGEGQTAWHKLSLCASHITGLGEGQGGQTEGQTAWQHITQHLPHHWAGGGAGGSDRGANSMTTQDITQRLPHHWAGGGGPEGQKAKLTVLNKHTFNYFFLGGGSRSKGQKAKITVSNKYPLFKNLKYFIVPCRKFRSPFSGKAQQSQERCYPFLSMCAVFLCVQTMVWGFFMFTQMLMHMNARGDCTDTVRVCTESWLGEKSHATHGTWTGVSTAPGLSVRTELNPHQM